MTEPSSIDPIVIEDIKDNILLEIPYTWRSIEKGLDFKMISDLSAENLDLMNQVVAQIHPEFVGENDNMVFFIFGAGKELFPSDNLYDKFRACPYDDLSERAEFGRTEYLRLLVEHITSCVEVDTLAFFVTDIAFQLLVTNLVKRKYGSSCNDVSYYPVAITLLS